jgi:hypothetical protein
VKRANVAPTKTGKEVIAKSPIDRDSSANCMRINGCLSQHDSKHSNNQQNEMICFHLGNVPRLETLSLVRSLAVSDENGNGTMKKAKVSNEKEELPLCTDSTALSGV